MYSYNNVISHKPTVKLALNVLIFKNEALRTIRCIFYPTQP